MQVGDVQFQRTGGRRPVALVRLQRAANRFSLKSFGRLAQIDVSRRGAAAAVSVGNIGAATANWKCCGSSTTSSPAWVARASTTAR